LIEVIRDAAALRSLEPEWRALFARAVNPPPFVHPGWMLNWWDCLGGGELHALTLRRSGELVGLLPAQRWQGRIVFLAQSISDRLDALYVDTEAAAEIRRALLDERLDLQELCPESALAGPDCEPWSICPVLDLRSKSVPSRVVKNLRTQERRLGEHTYETSDEAREYLPELYRLHEARWETKAAEGRGVLADARVREFHNRAGAVLSEAGLLRFHALRVKGVVIAVLYGLVSGGVMYYYLGGFDPSYSAAGPGSLLIYHAIEYARSSGDHAFDFLRGDEPYKYKLGAEQRRNLRLVR
jgi:CelD/BcsL family acetyltransferase involved in cellulose biosynthesis